jgi:hypothetical protein
MGEELWYVKLSNGDVHRVTIDQLDGAFQAGHIDEGTMVLAAGASQWTRLGDLAGLGDDESEAPEQPPVADTQAAQDEDDDFAYVPRHDDNEVLDYVPQVQAPIPQQAAYVPQVQAAPAAATPAGYIPQLAPPRGAIPVQPRAAAPVSYAPPANGTPYSVAVSMRPAPVAPYVPSSLRPMSMDLSDDLDMPVPRKGRAGRFAAAVVVLAGIAGGIGFEAQRAHIGIAGFGSSSSSDISNVAAAAAVAPPPPVAEPVVTPPPAPAPPPVAAPSPSPAANAAPAATGGSPMNPSFTSRFNEDTTKKLISADKARESKAKARHSGGGGGGGAASHTKSSGFTTGGNKFDPLNSSI